MSENQNQGQGQGQEVKYLPVKTLLKGGRGFLEVALPLVVLILGSEEFRVLAAKEPWLLALLPTVTGAIRALANFLKNYQPPAEAD